MFNEKFRKYWVILGVVVLATAFFVIFQYNQTQKNNKNNIASDSPEIILNTNQSQTTQEEQSASDLISEKCNYDEGNVGNTECIIELLDRTSAEREWKQRKIETVKHPQINTYDTLIDLPEAQLKMKMWREGFEKSRDAWCEAENFGINGSGIPASIASCQLEFEVSAINILNNLYYETIMKNISNSQGISDFEPTKADIEALIKTNKTKRGCVWAGENENCD